MPRFNYRQSIWHAIVFLNQCFVHFCILSRYTNFEWSTNRYRVSGSLWTDLTITIKLAAPFYPLIDVLHVFSNLVMYYANLEWSTKGYRVTGPSCTDFTLFIELAAPFYPLIDILLIFCPFFTFDVYYANLEWTTWFENNFFEIASIDFLLKSVVRFVRWPLWDEIFVIGPFCTLIVDYGNLEWTTCFENSVFRITSIELLLESVIGFDQRCLWAEISSTSSLS